MENRTKGLLQNPYDTIAQPVADDEADELIVVKDSNTTLPMTTIAKRDLDPVRHYRLSAEEIALVGQARSKRWYES